MSVIEYGASIWGNTNDLVVNLDKSKIVHFRTVNE
jgi:hypothetical protein